MARADLHADMVDAMLNVVLLRLEGIIKHGLKIAVPSARAAADPSYALAYEDGFKAAKRAMLDLLEGVGDVG